MYTLAIVEDELLMREFLIRCIDYKSLGLTLCGEFYDSEKALSVLSKEKPDIVITDIKMPKIDGIELMSKLLENSKNTRFIVISNCLNFPIVRNAFQLGICDYISKVDFSSGYLEKILRDIVKKLEEEKREKVLTDIKKEKVVRELYWDANVTRENQGKLRVNTDDLILVSFYILNYEDIISKNWSNDRELLKYGISNYIEEILQEFGDGEFFFNSYDEILLFFSPNDCENYIIKEVLIKTKEFLKNNFGIASCITMSDECIPLKALKSYHASLCKLRQYKFFVDEGNVITQRLIGNYLDKYDTVNELDSFEHLFDAFDFSGIQNEIMLLERVKPDYETIAELERFYASLFQMFKKYDDVYEVGFVSKKYFDEIIKYSNYRTAIDYFLEATKKIAEKVNTPGLDIYMVEKYVEENFLKDITLKSVAQAFGYEYRYFSRAFLKLKGVSFRKYLIDLRLGEAMKLIQQSDMKYKAIAERVGYQNYEHFSRSFKKKYNKWPKEIRDGEGELHEESE